MCCQQSGEKRLQHEFILGDTLGRIHTFKTKCAVKSATLHDQKHPLSSCQGNWKTLKKTGQENVFLFLPFLQKMKVSLPHLSWLVPFLQSHICQTSHIMMLWDAVKPYHKVYFSLILV